MIVWIDRMESGRRSMTWVGAPDMAGMAPRHVIIGWDGERCRATRATGNAPTWLLRAGTLTPRRLRWPTTLRHRDRLILGSLEGPVFAVRFEGAAEPPSTTPSSMIHRLIAIIRRLWPTGPPP